MHNNQAYYNVLNLIIIHICKEVFPMSSRKINQVSIGIVGARHVSILSPVVSLSGVAML